MLNEETVIYRARRIVTLNPARPEATHVAVRAGRVLGVGTLAELSSWGPHRNDDRFAERVLLPGFVEGHSHLMAGTLWRYAYVGYFDVTGPDGRVWPGLKSLEAVVAALQQAAAQGDGPVTGWGFDPIYFGERRCNRHDLDRVSTTRPVGVMHASGHILNVNSVALERAGFLRTGIDHPAFPLGADGLPRGTRVRVRITGVDELTLDVHASVVAKLDETAPADAAVEDNDDDSEEPTGAITLAFDVQDADNAAEPGAAAS